MFAKLKKKIQDEGGSVALGDADISPPVHGPGLASPIKNDMSGSSTSRNRDMSTGDVESVSSEISEVRATTSKEDLFKKIVKKNEQVKKLEGKITELAAMIKDRNKNIDRLEKSLEKQQQESEQKIQGLEAKYRLERTKSTEAAAGNSRKKENELQRKLEQLEQENQKLLGQLKESESFKIKHLSEKKQTEQKADLATIELASVKEMLSITQQDLEASQSELREKSKHLSAAGKKEQDLDTEIQSLMSQIGQLTTTNERLEEKVGGSNKELTLLQGQVKMLEQESQQKTLQLKTTSRTLEEVQQKYDVLERYSQQYQHKMDQMVKEKDENRNQLKERIHTLEERLGQSQLSGDERVTALHSERAALEQRLEEARQQLTNVKLTWSDKITRLEGQISHLNEKMADDARLVSEHEKSVESLKQNHQKHIQDLQDFISAKEQAIERLKKVIAQKDAEMSNKAEEHCRALEEGRQLLFDKETELTSSISDLQSQLETLTKARDRQTSVYEQKLMQLQSGQEEWLEKEIDAEKRVTSLEEKLRSTTSKLTEKCQECDRLNQALNQNNVTLKELSNQIKELTSTQKDREKRSANLEKDFAKLEKELTSCTNEKDELLLRNAQLSQEYESHKRRVKESEEDLREELQQKNNSIAGLEQVLQDMTQEVTASKTKIEELELQQMVAINDVESAEINRLKAEINNLEDQLLDRNKTIKKQQQRLADLKKTLQRELNVQALPNDEVLDVGRDSPKPSQGASTTSGRDLNPAHITNGYTAYHTNAASSGDERPALQVSSSSTVHVHKHSLYSGATNFSASDLSDYASNYRPKSSPTKSTGALKYQRDLNFDYLRHVVLKFMLSRESEAVHLIKAVAVLLDFTKEEQKLLKETLEYKMSWFGTRPKLGEGQFSKYVPPTY